MNQPTTSDLMHAIKEIHGDVKVALDRTATHSTAITALSSKVDSHGVDIATTKAQATIFGTVASALMVGLIEVAKSMFGGQHSS